MGLGRGLHIGAGLLVGYGIFCLFSTRTAGTGLFFIVSGVLILLAPRRRARREPGALRLPRSFQGPNEFARLSARFGPPAAEIVLDTTLAMTGARGRLEGATDDAHLGGVQVSQARDGDGVVAILAIPGSPIFFGRLVPSSMGAQLRGQLLRSSKIAPDLVFLAIAIVCAFLALVYWIATPDGRPYIAFCLCSGLAIYFGNLAVFTRIRTNWMGARSGDRLAAALATALGCAAPTIRPAIVAARTRWLARPVFLAFVAIASVLLLLSFVRAYHPIRGFVFVAAVEICFLVGGRITRWWTPRLDGSVLSVGFRRVDLDQVREVVAQGSAMSLADGHSLVVVPSLYGTVTSPRGMDEAPFSTWSPPTPATRRLAVSIDQVVRRCALDPMTARTLYRAPSRSELAKHPPLVLTLGVARLTLVLLAMVVGLLAVSLVR